MKKRLFVGIPLPHSWQDTLEAWCKKVKENNPVERGAIRWITPENFHLTICFLGWRDVSHIAAIQERLAEVAQAVKPFSLQFHDPIYAPPGGSRRMIWVVFSPSLAFTKLTQRVAKIIQVSPNRQVIPHVTIARFKGRIRKEALPPIETKTRRLLVTSFILYASQPRRDGPVYTVLKAFRL